MSMRRLLPVAESLGSVLAGLIPLALVIAVLPLSIIPAVLVLQAPRARPSSLAFLGGWLLGLAVLTALCIAGSGVFDHRHQSPPAWTSWLRVVLGSALIVFGIYRWFTRHGHTESPAWMRSFASISPKRAGITGAALVVVRVEVLAMCLAAGVDIGTSRLSVADEWTAAAFFVAVSASTIAIPVLGYAVAGHRLDEPLARLKD